MIERRIECAIRVTKYSHYSKIECATIQEFQAKDNFGQYLILNNPSVVYQFPGWEIQIHFLKSGGHDKSKNLQIPQENPFMLNTYTQSYMHVQN